MSMNETTKPTGKALIQAERKRQVEVEKFDAKHDDWLHEPWVLESAGVAYAGAQGPDEPVPPEWPWELRWWKPYGRERNLVRGGALFLAAADQHQRQGRLWYAEMCRGIADELGGEIDKLHAATVALDNAL